MCLLSLLYLQVYVVVMVGVYNFKVKRRLATMTPALWKIIIIIIVSLSGNVVGGFCKVGCVASIIENVITNSINWKRK